MAGQNLKGGFRHFVAAAAAGAIMAFFMPDRWSDLSYTPWYAAWILIPSFFIYAALCIATITDFVSNGGSPSYWLSSLWILSVAMAAGVYWLALLKLINLTMRLKALANKGGILPVKHPCPGPGRFQWNKGAWLGTQLGSTIWLLGAGLTLLPGHAEAAAVSFSCFLAANMAGLLLYRRRDRLAPYPAIQMLMLFVGVISILFAIYINIADVVDEIDPRLGYKQWGFYLLPALFGGLMAFFHILERKP